MKKNLIIVILVILVLGMGGYLVYDKVIDKDVDKKEKKEEVSDKVVKEKYDSFDEDIYYYHDHYITELFGYMLNDEIDKIDLSKYKNSNEELIKWYLYGYYNSFATKYNLGTEKDNDGIITYNVSKEELDKITYIVFGREALADYSFTFRDYYGIKKIDDENYEISWYATASTIFELYDENFIYSDDKIEFITRIKYIDQGGEHYIDGKFKVTFKYDSSKKIYYIFGIEEAKE